MSTWKWIDAVIDLQYRDEYNLFCMRCHENMGGFHEDFIVCRKNKDEGFCGKIVLARQPKGSRPRIWPDSFIVLCNVLWLTQKVTGYMILLSRKLNISYLEWWRYIGPVKPRQPLLLSAKGACLSGDV
jgi:hypothetical protein